MSGLIPFSRRQKTRKLKGALVQSALDFDTAGEKASTHPFMRNRTHGSEFLPLFLRAPQIPTTVARCFRLLFEQLLLVVGRVRFLVKPTVLGLA